MAETCTRLRWLYREVLKENIPEDGRNRWPKHVAGYVDYNVITIHINIWTCRLFLITTHCTVLTVMPACLPCAMWQHIALATDRPQCPRSSLSSPFVAAYISTSSHCGGRVIFWVTWHSVTLLYRCKWRSNFIVPISSRSFHSQSFHLSKIILEGYLASEFY